VGISGRQPFWAELQEAMSKAKVDYKASSQTLERIAGKPE